MSKNVISSTLNSSVAAKFKEVYNGATNFMTPDPIGYGKRGKYLYEVSQGEGFDRETIYGITVITETGQKCPTLSKGGFHSMYLVERYINTVIGAVTK